MKPNPEQAFLIGYLYGCSFLQNEEVEIWCRTLDVINLISTLLEDNGIKYHLRKESLRVLIVINSYKELSGFLQVFDIDISVLYPSNRKRSPEWMLNSEIGDVDIISSFFLGLMESSGSLNVDSNGTPSVNLTISSPSDDLISQLYHFFRLFKEEKTEIDTDNFFVSAKNSVGREVYVHMEILPLLFKKIAEKCSVLKFSKVYNQVT